MIYIAILALSLGLFIFTGYTFFGLVLFTALLYGIISIFCVALPNPKLTVEFEAPREAEKGRVYDAAVRINNMSSFPVMRCIMELSLKNLLTGREEVITLSRGLLPRRISEIDITGESDICGVLELSIRSAFLSDLLGIFKKKAEVSFSPYEILVNPNTEYVPLEQDDLERYDMESFKYADGKVGSDSSETVGIREYIPGDSIKGIHWKLSAKTGEIMVKEYGLPVDTKLMVLADKKLPKKEAEDRENDGEKAGEKRMESLAEFALSTSKTLLEKEMSHEFGWFSMERKSFERRTIQNQDDYQSMMKEFLSSGFLTDEWETVKGFLESEGNKDFAGFLFITLDEKEQSEMETLKEYGNVAIYSPK